jgi:signal transduction histidine kinase
LVAVRAGAATGQPDHRDRPRCPRQPAPADRAGRPKDELTELADTFDTMLDRLESAFESQRRFVANASHELRTPLAIQRAAVQIGLAGERSETVRRVSRQLLDANRRSERLIDGLLALARSDRGIEHREPVALHTIAAQELDLHTAAGGGRRIAVTRRLDE